jgi:hypothetical protein
MSYFGFVNEMLMVFLRGLGLTVFGMIKSD